VNSDVCAGFTELAAFVIAAGTFPAAFRTRCFVESCLPVLERTSRVDERVSIRAHGNLGLGRAGGRLLLRHLAASWAALATPRSLLCVLPGAFCAPISAVVDITEYFIVGRLGTFVGGPGICPRRGLHSRGMLRCRALLLSGAAACVVLGAIGCPRKLRVARLRRNARGSLRLTSLCIWRRGRPLHRRFARFGLVVDGLLLVDTLLMISSAINSNFKRLGPSSILVCGCIWLLADLAGIALRRRALQGLRFLRKSKLVFLGAVVVSATLAVAVASADRIGVGLSRARGKVGEVTFLVRSRALGLGTLDAILSAVLSIVSFVFFVDALPGIVNVFERILASALDLVAALLRLCLLRVSWRNFGIISCIADVFVAAVQPELPVNVNVVLDDGLLAWRWRTVAIAVAAASSWVVRASFVCIS
jgi:hypothetical protein